jgi:hypothetical protein
MWREASRPDILWWSERRLAASKRCACSLHEILDRAGPLDAVSAHNDQRLEAGRIYVAPHFHLLVEPGCLRVTKGPKEIDSGPRSIRCFARPHRPTAAA